MRACILNEVRQEPLDVLFVPQTEQTQLAVGLEPCVLHEVLHAHVLQRPPQLNPHPFDVVGCDAGRDVPVELKPAEPTFVTNCFVHKTNVAQAGIPLPLICVEGGTGQDVLDDDSMERLLLSVREDEEERLLWPIFPGLGKETTHLSQTRSGRDALRGLHHRRRHQREQSRRGRARAHRRSRLLLSRAHDVVADVKHIEDAGREAKLFL